MSTELKKDELKKLKKQILKNKYYYRFKLGLQGMVMKYYQEAHNYTYEFDNPKKFNEKINTRKLDKNPIYSLICDKIKVRDYVKNKLGGGEIFNTHIFHCPKIN